MKLAKLWMLLLACVLLGVVVGFDRTATPETEPAPQTSKAAPENPAELCPPAQTVFSCAIGSGKQIVVCATPDLGLTAGTLRYLFGRPGAVELHYPEKDGLGATPFFWSRYTRPMPEAASEMQLHFSRGEWRYTVFDESYENEETSSQSQGVRVQRGQEPAKDILCAGKPVMHRLFDLEDVVPRIE